MRAQHPALNFTLFSGRLNQIEAKLLAHELDLGIAPLEGNRPEGMQHCELLQLSMVLFVPKNSKLRSADALWQQDRLKDCLISLPPMNPRADVSNRKCKNAMSNSSRVSN